MMSYRRRSLVVFAASQIFLLTFGLSFQWTFAAVSFGAIGAGAAGTTSLSLPYPTGIVAGNLLVMGIANKHPTATPSVPSGWTVVTNGQASGGNGADAADSGDVYATVFVRIADGTESGNVSVTITSGNCAVGAIARYAKTGQAWDYAASYGNDGIAGHTAWSVTAAANPGITAGDMMITVSAINTDAYSYSSQDISATSITWGTDTERIETATDNGNDCGMVLADHAVTSGTASAAPVFTMTSSGSSAVAPTGSTVFLRIREQSVSGTGVTLTGDVVEITASTSVVGTLAKGAGSFVIDHPLDPLNKLLYHFFVESPDVKNIYDGIITLNGGGEASIELPSYFLALNKDFRYLATPIGEPMPNLHLVTEVRKRWFNLFGKPVLQISGGAPNGRVSWQVTGTRHDPLIEANPIVVEVEKGPDQLIGKGEYLHPEVF